MFTLNTLTNRLHSMLLCSISMLSLMLRRLHSRQNLTIGGSGG